MGVKVACSTKCIKEGTHRRGYDSITDDMSGPCCQREHQKGKLSATQSVAHSSNRTLLYLSIHLAEFLLTLWE